MPQAKFSLDQEYLSFLERHRDLGFRDKSEMVRSSFKSFPSQLGTEEKAR